MFEESAKADPGSRPRRRGEALTLIALMRCGIVAMVDHELHAVARPARLRAADRPALRIGIDFAGEQYPARARDAKGSGLLVARRPCRYPRRQAPVLMDPVRREQLGLRRVVAPPREQVGKQRGRIVRRSDGQNDIVRTGRRLNDDKGGAVRTGTACSISLTWIDLPAFG